MSFVQASWPEVKSPLLYTDGETLEQYPVCLLACGDGPGDPTVQVIQICQFEGKTLCAVPQAVWNRAVSKRVLPQGSLLRPNLVEVQASLQENLFEPLEGAFFKLWVGFLREDLVQALEILDEFSCDYYFEEEGLLPFGRALVEVAQDHYAFFSADGGPRDAEGLSIPEDVEEEMINGAPLTPEEYGSVLEGRITKLEDMMVAMNTNLQSFLNQQGVPNQSKKKPTPKPGAKTPVAKEKVTRKTTTGGGVPGLATSSSNPYPNLDAGVVKAALQAGVPAENLAEMQKLMTAGGKAAKTKDLNMKVKPTDYLSEDEALDSAEELIATANAEPGLVGGGNLSGDALSRLTEIVELLTDEKKKKASGSLLERALDVGGGTSSSEAPLQGSGKKAAAARRALRTAFEERPEEISALVEKLMYEDLNSTTLPPGMPARGLNARAWVEHRSRVMNYRTSVYAAWGAAGILDSLIQGHVAKARARAALMVLMIDQSSVDRGNWSLAGELSLEGAPPFSSFANHTAPSIADGEPPFSKLLDPRWAEQALAFLKDQDDYLVRRANVAKASRGGKDKTGAEESEAEPKRKSKAKPKPKAAADAAAT